MPILVQKYGGSSVADTDKLKRVAEQVVAAKTRGFEVVVVVSAMGNTTDELLDLARQINPSPNGRELDMLVSVGERVSMALLSMAIHALGHHAISFTGSQSGIITNDSAGAARIIEVRPYRVQDELSKGHIVIVAGYQGVSYKREVTTLGRGGSDTTAVALAAALGADACEIYSDVDGVHSADPRVVLDAHRLGEVTYEEMLELARFGAKVLNADAVEFARRSGIALFARLNTGEGSGTRIVRPDGYPDAQLAEERAAFVTGVAGRKDVVKIALRAEAGDADALRELLAQLGRAELLFSHTSDGGAVALIATENLTDPTGWLQAVTDAMGDRVAIETELGLATAVGARVGARSAAQERVLRALGEAGLRPRLTFVGRESVSALLPADRVEDAMRALHHEFLNQG